MTISFFYCYTVVTAIEQIHEAMIEVTKNTRACFIDKRPKIDELDKIMITEWLKAMSKNSNTEPIEYSSYLKLELVSALENVDKIQRAILTSNHIWCESNFEERKSAEVFYKTLEWAKQNNVRDKVFFDLAYRVLSKFNLLSYKADAFELIADLKVNNNISFLFGEEILTMIGV